MAVREVESVDVVVVGAGLSGLVAARELLRRGHTVRVLEARERVGGRLLSQPLGDGDNWIDLGGQWIGPGQFQVAALARELGVERFRQYDTGKKCIAIGSKTSHYRGTIPSLPVLGLVALQRAISQLDTLMDEVPLDRPYEAEHARRWDAMTVESWKREHVPTEAARTALDFAVRSVFGAEPSEISFLHFLFYLKSGEGLMRLASIDGGAQQERFVGGAQALCTRLSAGFVERITFGAPVQAIVEDGGSLRVEHAGGAVRARRVVVALAPVLAGRIHYEPAMPAARDQLTQRMPMGSIIKCVAAYERPFWREKGFSGELLSDSHPVGLGFDDTSADGRHPALVGFFTGDAARQWTGRSSDERRQAVLATFAHFFGREALYPTAYVDHDWLAEPWTRGCYVGFMTPGTQTSYGSALRAPVGRIHWAGTETARHWNGYMDGAIEAGKRAAREVVQAIGASERCSVVEG